jgi:hypothetical protein
MQRFQPPIDASLLLTLALLTSVVTSAWGKAGNRIVTMVATSLLTAELQTQIADLLDPGLTLADIST